MTITAYTNAAIKFAKDSADWADMDPRAFYSTSNADIWAETCDNAHGGLLLDWAFHLSEDEIRASAPQKMLDQLASMWIRPSMRAGTLSSWAPSLSS